MPKSTKTPFDKVREAFAELDASEKTAFVLEATFAAVGEGLAETGRRFSGAVQDIDDLFTPGSAPKHAESHDEEPAKPKASRKKSTRKSGGTSPGSTGKTAGKPTKPDTDDDA